MIGTNPEFDMLYLFWSSAYFVHAKEGQLGSSWIELYARFTALGDRITPPQGPMMNIGPSRNNLFFCQCFARAFQRSGH